MIGTIEYRTDKEGYLRTATFRKIGENFEITLNVSDRDLTETQCKNVHDADMKKEMQFMLTPMGIYLHHHLGILEIDLYPEKYRSMDLSAYTFTKVSNKRFKIDTDNDHWDIRLSGDKSLDNVMLMEETIVALYPILNLKENM